MTTWDTIVGHQWARDLLKGAITNQRIGHAYLITGQSQVGKTTLARVFAQALNCTHEDSAKRPCGRCRSCTLIAGDKHPDVKVVDGEISSRGRLSIKIDQIRQLQQELALSSTEARYKVAIVRNFESTNPNAANAFLKTLEEPPANVILLLTATESDSLLPTITSRCRTIPLRPLPTPDVEAALRDRWQLEPERAKLLARLADGRLGWAVSVSLAPEMMDERDKQIQILLEILGGNRVMRFKMADKLARQPESLPALLQTWLSWWRDLTLMSWQASDHGVTNIDQRDHLTRVAAAWERASAVEGLKETRTALWQLEHNANTRLVIENLFLRYPLPAAS